ncbi:MAG: MFS transporter, partial [Acidimicrobiia bacterium]
MIAFLVGSMAVVFDSGLQSWMTVSLMSNDLVRANAWLGLARTITLSIGPLFGGLVIALGGGFAVAFGLNAITFGISAVMLLFVRPITEHTQSVREPFRMAFTSGIKVLFADPRLKWGTLGGTVTNFVFQPLEALLVLFVATEVLDLDTGDNALTTYGLAIGLFFALQAGIGSIGVAFAGRAARRLPLGSMYIVGLAMLGGGFL